MKTEIREIVKSETVYIANDGKEFKDENSCRIYETRADLRNKGKSVWLVYPRRVGGNVEVFSTKELAERSLENSDDPSNFVIREEFIDYRFIRNKVR